jgi:DNA-binding SARP family transcriptional activator
MSTIRFFLFGKFRIEADAKLIQKIEPRKAEELLVYLLLYRDQPQSREHLAEILWGEISPEQSKSYLRKALWQLQSILEPYLGPDILLIDGEWLQINPQYNFWLDIEVLDTTFRNTQGIRGKDLDERQARSILEAVNTYSRDLLEGWYQDWCLYERERLQHLYLTMLDKLMDRCEARKDYENGLMFGERILQYDRARERTHRQLMRLYYLAADRTSSLRQYQRCVAALKEELDVDPAERTRSLYEMIREDKLEPPAESNNSGKNKKRESEEPLSMLFNHLSKLHKSLSQIQRQIAQDMQVIQKTMEGDQS